MTRDSDTHPAGGDVKQAPFMGSAGRKASPRKDSNMKPSDRFIRLTRNPDLALESLKKPWRVERVFDRKERVA